MRVIISRKGFDSAAGGCPSPIVDGRPYSLPIPSGGHKTGVRFADLPYELGSMLNDLSKDQRRSAEHCHLDPDLDPRALRRLKGWRGAFGQCASSQSHLSNQGVTRGDLFLFFGLFRHVERVNGRWRFVGPREHRLFGWLQIDHVLAVGSDSKPSLRTFPWLRDHPHVDQTFGWGDDNTIYVGTKALEVPGVSPSLPGWGLFPKGLTLTAPGQRLTSVWSVPDWLNPKRGGTGCTFNPPQRFSKNGRLRSPGRGQEFVADITGRRDAKAWLNKLFRTYA
jgi:hypothetical protein